MFEQSIPEQSIFEQPLQCQIPLAWQMQLETIAQRTGQSVEQVIYQAIGRYLGQLEILGQLERRSLESTPAEESDDEPDEILTSFSESDEFQERVRQAIAPSHSPGESPLYEEIENEPDEILYDFLEP
jgi:hypothetical protein